MCQMSIGHMLLQTGLRPAEFWFSAGCFAEGLVKMRELYAFDGILVSLHGHSPAWEKEAVRIIKKGGGEEVIWKNGDKTFCPSDDLPIHVPAKPAPVPAFSDFDQDSMAQDLSFIPVSQGLEFRFDQDHLYDIFDLVKSRCGAGYSIHGEVTSPFDYFLNLFGFEQALIALLENPSKSKAVLERLSGAIAKTALAQVGCGVDAIKISSPFAGSGFISPAYYREFVLPFEGRIARAVRARGIPIYTHTCGAINDRLEMMIEAGVSGIECLDPPPLGNVELGEAKKRIGKKAFIKGNIDPVNVMLFGDLESVKKDAAARIETGKKGGGYILSTACSIAPHTKRENIQVLSSLAEVHGSY
jgi:hypothetical protein